ncbi:hypothetical protein [Spirochaeta isovalerica]|uniref:Uncharacterized protein n=1 Tax=Spirochaeta isovalerica TaxID=150 RepID=A0A841R5H9_9SPIO|nr:hypothetical protein [Spirochaeta isovalerica]MBB6480434.1 hypothetical protein [Spirochaeta isovalerica]
MKKVNYSIYALLFFALLPFLSFASGRSEEIKVQNYNTIRIVGDSEEQNNIDPEHNRKILPYVLKEDLLDLLAGGIVINLPDENFDSSPVLKNLILRDFAPTTYVYYSNDTKKADTECYYQGEDLIYYSRTAYNYCPFQKVGMTEEAKEIKKDYRQEDITLNFSVYPVKTIDRNTAEYGAFCSFFYLENDDRDNIFKDAVVYLNDTKLKSVNSGFFKIDKKLPVFRTGETISFSIEHELIGKISGELTVPAPLDSFTLEPALQTGVPSDTDDYLLSWEKQNCDGYDLTVYRAMEEEQIDSYGLSTDSLFHKWDPWELQENGDLVPFLRFSVSTSNIIRPEGFN